MLKKSLLVAAAVALLLGLLFGRDAISYVSTSVAQLRQQMKDNVPIEFELERARQEIKNLDPEIRRNMHTIASEEVQLDRIAADIQTLEKQLAKEESELLTLQADWDSGESFVSYNDRQFTREEVGKDLKRRLENCETKKDTLAALERQFDARKKSLEAARDKLDAMLAAKDELKIQVDNLEARMKMVEVAKTTANFNFDDSKLSRTKELVSDIDTRIKTEEALLNHVVEHDYHIPVTPEEPTKDISQEIADYFGSTEKPDLVNFKAAQ